MEVTEFFIPTVDPIPKGYRTLLEEKGVIDPHPDSDGLAQSYKYTYRV